MFDEEPDAGPHDECRAEIARLTALVADAACLPPGFLAEVAAILRAGAARHGVAPHETGGGQTTIDHLDHARAHLERARFYAAAGRPVRPDADSGRAQEAHVAARCALAWGAR